MASVNLKGVRRFGPRYGRTIKHKLAKIESEQRQKHKCPYCHYAGVKRVSSGIWHCHKCDARFTGKAYTPSKVSAISEKAKKSLVEVAAEELKRKQTVVEDVVETEEEDAGVKKW